MPGISIKEEIEKHLYAAVLCGGGGKRLWPRSRLKKPKQFIRLFGQETIFQETVRRIKPLIPFPKILVITNFDYVDEVRKQAPKIPKENIIAEPMAKNTALAMGVATVYVRQKDKEAVVANLPSDHLVQKPTEFRQALSVATQAALSGDWLVTIGLKPLLPHTGLGYIHAREEFGRSKGIKVLKVIKFSEKPNLEKAKRFVKSGEYFWNGGMYIWRVDSGLRAFAAHVPKMSRGLKELEKVIGLGKEKRVLRQVYEKAEDISIDYAISEKAKNMLVVPAEFGWSDIGDWKVVYDLGEKDENGNVIIQHGEKGEHLSIETKNCLVHFDDELIATLGVENLIIVDAGNLILICHKDKAQDVKKIVQALEKRDKREYL